MQRYIKEVFNDLNENNNLINAEIENINLYKKNNKLLVKVASDREITLRDIEEFEDYLIKGFKVGRASIDIDYKDGVSIDQNIGEEWRYALPYLLHCAQHRAGCLTVAQATLCDGEQTCRGRCFLWQQGVLPI